MKPQLFQEIMRKVSADLVPYPPPCGKSLATQCWVPTSRIGPMGPINEYSDVKINNTPFSRHVLMLALQTGEIPSSDYVTHKCDLKSCCNPRHLRVGTPSENAKQAVRRKLNKHATNQPKGEASGRAKRSDRRMAEIKWCLGNRDQWFDGNDFGRRSYLEVIAIYYKIPLVALYSTRRGVNWKSVLPSKPERPPLPQDIPDDAEPPPPDMTKERQRAAAVLHDWQSTEDKAHFVKRAAEKHEVTTNTIRTILNGTFYADVCPEIPRVNFDGVREVSTEEAKTIKATFARYQGKQPVMAIRRALARKLNMPLVRVTAVRAGLLHSSVTANPTDAITLSEFETEGL